MIRLFKKTVLEIFVWKIFYQLREFKKLFGGAREGVEACLKKYFERISSLKTFQIKVFPFTELQ
jgi:hypothetical protein